MALQYGAVHSVRLLDGYIHALNGCRHGVKLDGALRAQRAGKRCAGMWNTVLDWLLLLLFGLHTVGPCALKDVETPHSHSLRQYTAQDILCLEAFTKDLTLIRTSETVPAPAVCCAVALDQSGKHRIAGDKQGRTCNRHDQNPRMASRASLCTFMICLHAPQHQQAVEKVTTEACRGIQFTGPGCLHIPAVTHATLLLLKSKHGGGAQVCSKDPYKHMTCGDTQHVERQE